MVLVARTASCCQAVQEECHRLPARLGLLDLQHGTRVDLTEHRGLQTGQVLYGRVTVPTSPPNLSLTVVASWSEPHTAAPLWMFIRCR